MAIPGHARLVLLQYGKRYQAISDINRSLELMTRRHDLRAPRSLLLHYQRIRQSHGRPEQIYRARRENAEAYLYRGLCYKVLGQKDMALADFQATINNSTDTALLKLAMDELKTLK